MNLPTRNPLANSTCMACGADELEGFYDVRDVPVHSVLLLESAEEGIGYPTGAIDLAFCHRCGFIQNRAYDPFLQEYGSSCEETQAFSGVFSRFAKELAGDLYHRYDLEGRRVVEVGCGKGDFLILLAHLGIGAGLGIDPGVEPERIPEEVRGKLQFIPEYFSPSHVQKGSALLICRHTLEHIQDVSEFARTTRLGEGAKGVPVFYEVPAVERVLSEVAFWDIYYEHCSYFTCGSLARLFQGCGFTVDDQGTVYGNQYHLLYGHPSGSPVGRRQVMPEAERVAFRRSVADFRGGVKGLLSGWKERLEDWVSRGQRVILWGSGSKAVSFLTTLGIGGEVAGVVDINPYRQGKYLPGTGHRILAPGDLPALAPDQVVVMNPMYTQEIRMELEKLGLAPELFALS